jgi:AcrR family transcriptional regulator
MSPQERLNERRNRLLAAAFQQFGVKGYPATTIDALCADAHVSTRAFYECFSGREAMLAAVHERIITEAMAAVRLAAAAANEPVSAGLAAYVHHMTCDERRARIVHVEVARAGDPLQPARRRAVHDFAGLITTLAGDRTTLTAPELSRIAIGLVGAIQELLTEWISADPRPAPAEVLTGAQHIFRTSLR